MRCWPGVFSSKRTSSWPTSMANSSSRRRLHDPRWRQRFPVETNHVDHVPLPTRVVDTPPLERPKLQTLLEPEAEVYRALVLGTGDYFRKNGFDKAVLGLFRWYRLGALTGRCHRSSRPGVDHRDRDALTLHVGHQSGGCRRAGQPTGGHPPGGANPRARRRLRRGSGTVSSARRSQT